MGAVSGRLPGTSPWAMALPPQPHRAGPVLATQWAQCQPYGLQSPSRNLSIPTPTLPCCNPLEGAELSRKSHPLLLKRMGGLMPGYLFPPFHRHPVHSASYFCCCCSLAPECIPWPFLPTGGSMGWKRGLGLGLGLTLSSVDFGKTA